MLIIAIFIKPQGLRMVIRWAKILFVFRLGALFLYLVLIMTVLTGNLEYIILIAGMFKSIR